MASGNRIGTSHPKTRLPINSCLVSVCRKSIFIPSAYPPNPVGRYDMGFYGKDSVNDWFDPHYYDYSPEKNPQGPPSGTQKVARGFEGGYDQSATTVYRDGEEPAAVGKGDLWRFPTTTFRCALQFASPQ